jgi:hypothetical protein
MRLFYSIGCFILLSCNNNTASTETKVPETAMHQTPEFTEDSIPSYDALKKNDSLDKTTQLQLFRKVLKPMKVQKLYDFSAIKQEKLLEVYRNFDNTFTNYIDSPRVYITFFNAFYNYLETYELSIPGIDTMVDVRTRLEIARTKSQIKDRLVKSMLNKE